jgi:general secretion pathway protein N
VKWRIAILMLAAGALVSMPGDRAPAAIVFDPAPPSVEVAETTRSGNPLWAVPLAVLHETRERPIFSVSRRPPSPPVVAAAVEALPPPRLPPPRPERPALVLLGTVSGEALHFGIFHNPATTKTLRLAVGENFEGWVLRAVSSADARFEYEGQMATLELRPAAKLAMKGEQPADADVPVMPVRRKRR